MFDRLTKASDKICKELCQYNGTIDEYNKCDYVREHGKCPLEIIEEVANYRSGREKYLEKKIKRIGDQIDWCDDVQNNDDEAPEFKKDAKRVAYDFIRKAFKEKED